MTAPTSAESLAIISHRMSALHDDMGEMKTAQHVMTQAITKLVLVEERQAQFTAGQERMFLALEKLENRITALERSEAQSKQTVTWVNSAVWAVVVSTAAFIAKKVGLL